MTSDNYRILIIADDGLALIYPILKLYRPWPRGHKVDNTYSVTFLVRTPIF